MDLEIGKQALAYIKGEEVAPALRQRSRVSRPRAWSVP